MAFPDYEKDLKNPEIDLELILACFIHERAHPGSRRARNRS